MVWFKLLQVQPRIPKGNSPLQLAAGGARRLRYAGVFPALSLSVLLCLQEQLEQRSKGTAIEAVAALCNFAGGLGRLLTVVLGSKTILQERTTEGLNLTVADYARW